MPRAYLVARFNRFYPGLYWAPQWRTPDGVIPYPLFFVLLRAIANVAAAEQLQDYFAGLLAAGQVWGGKDASSSLQSAVRSLTALAYPER